MLVPIRITWGTCYKAQYPGFLSTKSDAIGWELLGDSGQSQSEGPSRSGAPGAACTQLAWPSRLHLPVELSSFPAFQPATP